MKNLLLALQFLTIIPIRIKQYNEKKLADSLIYFPLIGLFFGITLIGINYLLSIFHFEQIISNIILVISLIVITGGLHMDGLADTFDAFLSRKNKEDMLKIMQDSHIGAMGALALLNTILLKIFFLSSIGTSLKTISLILMCVFSRWSLVFAIFLFPYARQEGKAKVFIQEINFKIFILATVFALVCTVLIGRLIGLFIFAVIAMSAYIIGKFINKKIGGITGDTLGAISELIEVITLFSIYFLEKINLWMI